jgi:glycosyltransferase involved in cell wall biosynthesis
VSSPGGASLGIVVSTIGRPASFRRLVESLDACPDPASMELILVDQSDDRGCTAVLESQEWRIPWRAITSGRGASVGRNAGLALTQAPVVAFPDDDAWYPPETPARVVAALTAADAPAALCGRQVTADGRSSMLRWMQEPTEVSPWNFLRTSIMSTMFFRRDWLAKVGDFDEGMGVGSAGWYGACEESDLLLRVIEAGGRVPYDPTLLVFQDEPRDDPDDRFVTKMLNYGCGQGRLWRKRDLPKSLLAWYLARKLVAAGVRTARGDRVLARADLAWLRGNVAGFRDVPPHELAHRAVAR